MVNTKECINPKDPNQSVEALLLTGIFAPLLSAGVDAVGRAIKDAGEDKTDSIEVTIPLEVTLTPSAKGELARCMIFVRGKFFHDRPPPDLSDRDKKTLDKIKEDVRKEFLNVKEDMWNVLAEEGIFLAGNPHAVLELEVVTRDNGKILRFEPRYLAYRKSLRGRSNEAIIVAQLNFYEPGASVVEGSNSGSALVLGEYEPGEGPWLFGEGSPVSPWFTSFMKSEPKVSRETAVSAAGAFKASLDSLDRTLTALNQAEGDTGSATQAVETAKSSTKEIDASVSNSLKSIKNGNQKLQFETIPEVQQAIDILDSMPPAFEDSRRALKSAQQALKQAANILSQSAKSLEPVKRPEALYFNATLKFVETQKGSPFMKALSTGFDAVSDDIQEELLLGISSEKQKQKNIEELEEQSEAFTALATKLQELGQAEKTFYCESDTKAKRYENSALLRAAQYSVYVAGVELGIAVPVTESSFVEISGAEVTVPNTVSCEQ